MGILSTSTEAVAAEAVGQAMHAPWLRRVGALITGASGAAVVLGGYEVLTSQPEQAFKLLQSWGPTFIVVLLIVFLAAKLGSELIRALRDAFGVMAGSARLSADAAGRTADALTKLAEQGGKQGEEVKMLALYAAQEFPGVYRRFDRQDQTLAEMGASLKDLTTSIGTLTTLHSLGNALKEMIPEKRPNVE